MIPVRLTISTLALTPLLASPATAQVVWDEAVDGDLSGNPGAPTPVSLAPGRNVIIGSVTSAFPSFDTRDYVTFTIPVGKALGSLNQLSYVDLPGGGPGDRGYHALDEGPTSLVPDMLNGSQFLGGAHMDPQVPGTDLLPDLASALLAGVGFDIPLGHGEYTYLIQQTGDERSGYELEFVIVDDVEIGARYCTPGTPNSTGNPGAMAVFGSEVVADDQLGLLASDLPPSSNIGYFIMGTGFNTFTPPGSAGPICITPACSASCRRRTTRASSAGGFARVRRHGRADFGQHHGGQHLELPGLAPRRCRTLEPDRCRQRAVPLRNRRTRSGEARLARQASATCSRP